MLEYPGRLAGCEGVIKEAEFTVTANQIPNGHWA